MEGIVFGLLMFSVLGFVSPGVHFFTFSSCLEGSLANVGATEWYTNVSQAVDRKSWGGTLRCLTSSTLVYDTRRDRLLTGFEMLALQGLPCVEIADCLEELGHSDKDLAAMAGQGIHLATLGSLLMSFVLNPKGGWWKPRGEGASSASAGPAAAKRVRSAPPAT